MILRYVQHVILNGMQLMGKPARYVIKKRGERYGRYLEPKNQTRINLWYKALGLVALVYLVIHLLFFNITQFNQKMVEKYICEILKEDIIYF